MRALRRTIIAFLVVFSTMVLSAQTVVDPRFVEFDPSADHNTTLVTSYSLSLFLQGSSQATHTMNLGKPAPGGNGKILVDFLPLLPSAPAPGVVYEARVSAIGPGGSTPSTPSNTFSWQAPCAPTIAPAGQSFAAAGGPGSVGVTAGAGCTWSAQSNATWITISGATGGTGNGTLNFNVQAYTGTQQRQGTLTVAGQTFTVTQAGVSCTATINPTSQTIAAAGGPGSTAVTIPAGCAWSAQSNATWITISGATGGTGNGTLNFNVQAYTGTQQRQGTLTVAQQTFTVTQTGVACTGTINPTSLTVAAGGGPGSTAVAIAAACTWSAQSNATWITISGATGGTGNGTLNFNVQAYTGTQQRQGTLTVAQQTFTVTQTGVACTGTINPTSLTVAAGGGPGSTAVTIPAGCAWSAQSNASWIMLGAPTSGTGNGTVSFNVLAHTSPQQRQGTVTIANQTFTVTQNGVPCTATMNPTSQTFAAAGGPGSTAVTMPAGCAWSAQSNATWITISGASGGTGNGTLNFNVQAHTGTQQRQATLTIAGQTFNVTQNGVPCIGTIDPTNQTFAAAGGPGSTAVTIPAGCAWSAQSNATWITINGAAGGTGNGAISFGVQSYTGTQQRQGTLTIANQTFTVTQNGVTCTASLNPTSQNVPSGGTTTGSTAVTTPAGCSWTATSNAGWIQLTGATSGSGNGSVPFSVTPSTSAQQRTGTVTIASQTFTVIQAANTCNYTLIPASRSMTAAGGSGVINVGTTTGCAWAATTTFSWITVTGSSNASGSANYSIAANPTTSQRIGTISIGTRTFTLTQAAAACAATIDPTSLTVAPAGGPGSTAVTAAAGCAWNAVSNAGWITLSGATSGTGNGTASFNVQAYTGTQSRIGTLTVANQTLTVTQNGSACSATLNPTSQNLPAAGGTGSTAVTTTAGCSWTAASNSPWIVLTGATSGTGNGNVSFSVDPSSSPQQRSGTLTIAGRTFTVNQAANTCNYTLIPASRSMPASGGSGVINVGTTTGCGWTAATTFPWITVTGSSNASGSANYTVAANATPSIRIGTISIGTDTFTVTQAGAQSGSTVAPFGGVDTPLNNATGVTGAIPFTGWALDDVGVAALSICRSGVGGEVPSADARCSGQAQIFVGDAIFIDGARPDVEDAYPTYPQANLAGWGFMLLSNMLPSQGNGTYTFQMYARDVENQVTLLGTRTITCDNANATKPFGMIDTPGQGAIASGASYMNFGWALTQNPKIIPINGSTLHVFVDGLPIGNVTYNNYREDIATLFPGLQNSAGAVGFRVIDTTALANGLHTISWTATDSAGQAAGLGSRFFTVSNIAPIAPGLEAQLDDRASSLASPAREERGVPVTDIEALPADQVALTGRRGWDLRTPMRSYAPDGSGRTVVVAQELDRVELWLKGSSDDALYTGYRRAGSQLAALPVGANLDTTTGQFTWAPGVGFIGTYDLVFVQWKDHVPVVRHEVRVVLRPKDH